MKNYLAIGIMVALQSGKRYTAKDLSIKFETSIKTIYRTIDILLQAGMPILSLQGKNGGYELIKESSFNSSFFTMNELCSFISFLKTNNEKFSGSISIDDRLSQLADKNLISSIKNQSKQIVIDTNLWGHNEKSEQIAQEIKDFIANKQKIRIEYISSKNQMVEERTIHPYTLVYKSDSWYVYAFCETRNSFRLFKISRIKSFTPLNQTYIYKDIDILSKPWNKDFNNNLEEINIEIMCSPLDLNDILDWLGSSIEIKNELNSDSIFVKGKAHYSLGLVHKIIEFGNKIKVVGPEKLKQSLCQECINIYNSYNEKSAPLV